MMKQGMDNEHFWPYSPTLWMESRTSGRTAWCLNPELVGETACTRGGGLPSSSIAGRSLEGQICRTAEWYLWIVCFKVTLVLLKSAFSFSSWRHNTVIISHCETQDWIICGLICPINKHPEFDFQHGYCKLVSSVSHYVALKTNIWYH